MSRTISPAVTALIAAQTRQTLAQRISSSEADTVAHAVVNALQASGWHLTTNLGRRLLPSNPEMWDFDPTILAGLARGHTTDEIADATGVPLGTVRNRILRLRRRLGAANAAHAVAIAYRRGWMAGLPPEPRPPVELSTQQLTVLAHMADGLDNQQIADAMDISRDTACTYVRRVYNALAASRPRAAAMCTRPHAVALAFQHGHLPLEEPQLADAA